VFRRESLPILIIVLYYLNEDDKMLVVIRGEIAISAVNSKTGVAELLRVAKQGDKLLSLLSLIDALTVLSFITRYLQFDCLMC